MTRRLRITALALVLAALAVVPAGSDLAPTRRAAPPSPRSR